MNFRNPKRTQLIVGETARGNSVKFQFVSEDRIRTWDVDASPEDQEKTTRLQLECSFPITSPMADLLDSSKIVKVESFSNEEKHVIELYPLPYFDYLKFQDVLIDLSERYSL